MRIAARKPVYFVTSNPGKLETMRSYVSEMGLNLNVRMLKARHPEVKTDDTLETTAMEKARYCAVRYRKAVIATDVGIFVESLKGFPGVNTAFSLDRIGLSGLAKLLEGEENRKVVWRCALAYCEPKGRPAVFSAEREGAVADAPRGDRGFGWDPLFIPAGRDKTFGEEPAFRDELSPVKSCLAQLAAFLSKGEKKRKKI